jgi:hypothetical protein
VNCLDHLLPFVDNGGNRSNVDRRRNSKIAARIPERRTGKDRRINDDRRKTLQYDSAYGIRTQNEKRLNR